MELLNLNVIYQSMELTKNILQVIQIRMLKVNSDLVDFEQRFNGKH